MADRSDRIERFAHEMNEELAGTASRWLTPPIERRRLRTVLAACGQRGTGRFLGHLEDQLQRAGIYSEPPLSDRGLRLDDWVLFSTGPFPPDSAFFPREKDLQRFVQACLGSSVFRGLVPCRVGNQSGWEYQLPDRRRIDLLCEERTKTGVGALVAIELKREHERGTIQQMIEYLDALKLLFPERRVRGIVVSGREDQVSAALLRKVTEYRIDWFCYEVTFRRIETSGRPTA